MWNINDANTLILKNLYNKNINNNKIIEISNKIKQENNFENSIFIPVSLVLNNNVIQNELIYNKYINKINNKFVISVCSRCIKEKGWEEVINIIINLNKEYNNNFILFLIGNGDFFNYLYEKYNKYDFIIFTGFIEYVGSYINISDLILIPSYFKGESTPLILIESLYYNKPVITTNIGDVYNMLKINNDQFAGSIINLIDNNKINCKKFEKEIYKYYSDKIYYNNIKNNIIKIKRKI